MKIQLSHKFEDIISVDNLLLAWEEFIKGKRNKKDVQEFSFRLMDNILSLHHDLNNHTYKHGGYQAFRICDPKPRIIHKTSVRDRLLHHAIYRILYPFFDKIFIADSFSCRINKGTHKAVNRFRSFIYKASNNNTKNCWVLKCDIKKFFASIDHTILKNVLKEHISYEKILWVLGEIIDSFYSIKPGIGLPLGNLTSQLFANIYMNSFDQLVKHKLKGKYYIRYSDDFVLLGRDKMSPYALIPKIDSFLKNNLNLSLHPDKIFIKTIFSGIDFLGWIHFSDHKVVRTATKRRILKRLKESPGLEKIQSYLGLLKHGNTLKLRDKFLSICKML